MLFAALLGASLGAALFSAPVIGLLAGVASFGLSSLSGAQRSQKTDTGKTVDTDLGSGTKIGGYSLTTKAAATNQQIIYGLPSAPIGGDSANKYFGGTVVFQDADPSGIYLSLVIVFAGYPVGFGGLSAGAADVRFDNYRVSDLTSLGLGFVNNFVSVSGLSAQSSTFTGFASNHWDGYARMVWKDGTHTDNLDVRQLPNFSSRWTADHLLKGFAHLAVVLKYDSTKWPNGIPNFVVSPTGPKILDYRNPQSIENSREYEIVSINDGAGGADTDFTTYGAASNTAGLRFTANQTATITGTGAVALFETSGNPALIIRDFLKNPDFGLGESEDNIDNDSFNDAADACDETFTLSRPWSITEEPLTGLTGPIGTFNQNNPMPRIGDTAVIRSLKEQATSDTDFTEVGATNNTVGEEFTLTALPYTGNTSINLTGDGTLYINETKTGKYNANGAFLTSAPPAEILENLAASMAGTIWYSQGKWRVKAGKYVAPTVTLTEDDIRGEFTVSTKHPRRENYNGVTGTFRSERTNNQTTQFPVISDSSFVAEDGGVENNLFISFPYASDVYQCARLARIALQKQRKQITISGEFGLKAMKIQIADVVNITNSRFNFSAKPFEVVDWVFSFKDREPIIKLVLRETAPDVYDDLVNEDVWFTNKDLKLVENWN